jgi:urea transporter
MTYRQSTRPKGKLVIGVLIAVLLAALVYFLCMALGLPAIIAIVAAVLVLLAGIPSGGYGLGSRWGGRRGF